MKPSTLVKSSNVLSNVKMNGELNTVQNLKPYIVLIHSNVNNAQDLGIVTTSMISLLKLLLTMIPTMMVKSILVITSINLISLYS